jgi:hypothetical protein
MSDAAARPALERAIAGALRATIHDHGPITAALVASATKRVLGQLQNVGLPGPAAGAALVRARWKGTTAEERKASMPKGLASSGGHAVWAGMTKRERSEEMKRRAALRERRRASRGEAE